MIVRRVARFAVPVLCLIASAGSCAHTVILLDPGGPRFTGAFAPAAASADLSPAPIRIVTFNIKLGRRIDRAAEVLRSDSLRGADILALEEMDDAGVARLARALGLNYVYYPGSIHPTDHRYFGPAVLTRWPIERSWKLLLPHEGSIRHQRRTATAAEVRVRGRLIRVYAVHLETQLRITDGAREDQVRTVLTDAAPFDGPVVIAGDFNDYRIGLLLQREGYRWLTSRLEPSIAFFSWDHIFVRGLAPSTPASAGVEHEVQGASDHRPVWAVVAATGPAPAEARRN